MTNKCTEKLYVHLNILITFLLVYVSISRVSFKAIWSTSGLLTLTIDQYFDWGFVDFQSTFGFLITVSIN